MTSAWLFGGYFTGAFVAAQCLSPFTRFYHLGISRVYFNTKNISYAWYTPERMRFVPKNPQSTRRPWPPHRRCLGGWVDFDSSHWCRPNGATGSAAQWYDPSSSHPADGSSEDPRKAEKPTRRKDWLGQHNFLMWPPNAAISSSTSQQESR